mgnify:CR=1 FL=1
MSPEREPMENDSNSRTAEELEQQTVDVYVERALHGPVFRMSYEHTHTYCEIFYLKSGTCTYTVNQGQWHLEAGDLFIVAAGDPHSTRYEGKTSCERIIVFCKSDVLAGMMRGDPTEVQQALERSCKVILNAETRTMVEALLDQMLLENDLPRKYSEQVLELEPEHLSCYGLKVEPGTPLDDRVVRGEKLPDDDQQAIVSTVQHAVYGLTGGIGGLGSAVGQGILAEDMGRRDQFLDLADANVVGIRFARLRTARRHGQTHSNSAERTAFYRMCRVDFDLPPGWKRRITRPGAPRERIRG